MAVVHPNPQPLTQPGSKNAVNPAIPVLIPGRMSRRQRDAEHRETTRERIIMTIAKRMNEDGRIREDRSTTRGLLGS